MIRQLREAVASGDKDAADGKLREAASQLHKAASKGVLHRRTADRQSGRLARSVAALKG
jgi:small subunit ribosomal protein S20